MKEQILIHDLTTLLRVELSIMEKGYIWSNKSVSPLFKGDFKINGRFIPSTNAIHKQGTITNKDDLTIYKIKNETISNYPFYPYKLGNILRVAIMSMYYNNHSDVELLHGNRVLGNKDTLIGDYYKYSKSNGKFNIDLDSIIDTHIYTEDKLLNEFSSKYNELLEVDLLGQFKEFGTERQLIQHREKDLKLFLENKLKNKFKNQTVYSSGFKDEIKRIIYGYLTYVRRIIDKYSENYIEIKHTTNGIILKDHGNIYKYRYLELDIPDTNEDEFYFNDGSNIEL